MNGWNGRILGEKIWVYVGRVLRKLGIENERVLKITKQLAKHQQISNFTVNQRSMVMIYLTKLVDFAKKHSDSGKSLSTWKVIVEGADWQKSQEFSNSQNHQGR